MHNNNWSVQDPKKTSYIWKHVSFPDIGFAGPLQDIESASGGLVASQDEDSNIEGGASSKGVPIVNKHVKTIEIVKRNGCYTVEEDGMRLNPQEKTRDEQLLYDDADHSLFKTVIKAPNVDTTPDEIRAVFESLKGGSNDRAINYTIGRARVSAVESDSPKVSPLLLRVRLEEGELPPSKCKISLRTVVVQGFDPTTRLQTIVDYSTRELGNVPISSVLDRKSNGMLLPYPASATLPLQTTLISKRRTRDAIDSVYNAFEDTGPPNRRQEAITSLFPSTADPVLKYVDAILLQSRKVVGKIGSALDRLASTAILRANMNQRLAEARSNTSYEYFTYGSAQKSVFADIASDLNAISDLIQQQSTEEYPGRVNVKAIIDVISEYWKVPNPTTTNSKPPVYHGLTQRQRELVEYLVGRTGRRNQPLEENKVINPGTVLSHVRTQDELNAIDPSGMSKEYQMHYRIDTYIDIELWDPQYNGIINITIVPGLQAALEAGRLVQCEGSKLRQDFTQLVRASRRLSDLSNMSYSKALSPDVYEIDNTPYEVPFKELLNGGIRRLLGLPAVLPSGDVRWEYAREQLWTSLPSNVKEIDAEIDWELLPFFRQNPSLQPFNMVQTDESRWSTPASYSPTENYTEERTSSKFLTRIIPQLVSPVKRTFGTHLYDAIVDANTESDGVRFSLKQTFASGYKLRRVMDKSLDSVVLAELAVGTTTTDNSDRRLLFYTVYDLSSVNLDGLTIGQRVLNTRAVLSEIYTSSVRSTLPFSPVYPNSVAAHIGIAFVASEHDVTTALQTVANTIGSGASSLAGREAAEAFAAILTNVLGREPIHMLTANDLTESVMKRTKSQAIDAADLILTIFSQDSAAIVGFDDPLLWLTRGSAAALVALNHCTCWQTQWNHASVIQGRSTWQRQMESFSSALKRLASSDKIAIEDMRFMNVQSNWISGRTFHPKDNASVDFIIVQINQSLRRVLAIAFGLQNVGVSNITLAAAIDDVLLSCPLVWRIPDERIALALGNTDGRLQEVDISVPEISKIKLTHAWACRRLDVPDKVRYASVGVDVGSLASSLAECQVDDSSDGECRYYVPMCCQTVARMDEAYDPTLSLQTVLSFRLNESINLIKSSVKYIGTDKKFETYNVLIRVTGSYDNNRRPLHPLFVYASDNGSKFRVHVPAQQSDLIRVFEESKLSNLEDYKDTDAIVQVMDKIRTSTLNTKERDRYSYLNDARRSLLFAVDRLYQSLLYARNVKYDGRLVVVIDLEEMPVMQSESACPSGWHANAPRPTTFVYSTAHPFIDQDHNRASNLKMMLIALNVAVALLPSSISNDMSFVFKSHSRDDSNLNESVVQTMESLHRAMLGAGVPYVLLGELVACLVHECFHHRVAP